MKNINPLLVNPQAINMAFAGQLQAEYQAYLGNLTSQFLTAADILKPSVPLTIYYYSDNDGQLNDTAGKEIQRHLHDYAKIVAALTGIEPPTIVYDNTRAQSWSTASFDVAQTTRFGILGVGNVTFLNCAPRLDETGEGDLTSALDRLLGKTFSREFFNVTASTDNKGEPVYVAILPNGHIISANSRYNFTFFRDMVKNGTLEIFEANVQTDGTQFRSRDIFAPHSIVLGNLAIRELFQWIEVNKLYVQSGLNPRANLEARRQFAKNLFYVDLDKPLGLEDIPALSSFTIANMDVHQNLKLNTRLSELPEEARARLKAGPFLIQIGNHSMRGVFTDKMFDRMSRNPVTGEKGRREGISPGSSGARWQGADHDDPLLEISIIHGKAAETLGITPDLLRKPVQVIIPGVYEGETSLEIISPENSIEGADLSVPQHG